MTTMLQTPKVPSPAPISYIKVSFMRLTLQIDLRTVAYFAGEGNYTRIYTIAGQNYLICKTLKLVKSKLNDQFVRVHKSFIVNLDFIDQQIDEGRSLLLKNGDCINVSRRIQAKLHDTIIDQTQADPYEMVFLNTPGS